MQAMLILKMQFSTSGKYATEGVRIHAALARYMKYGYQGFSMQKSASLIMPENECAEKLSRISAFRGSERLFKDVVQRETIVYGGK